MRKRKFFVSLAVSILLVTGFTMCKDPANSSGGKTLTGLEISSPVDTDYTEGQFFDITDLVVMATYSNKASEDVTDKCSFEPDLETPLTIDDTVIVISYTEDGFTLKANHCITVNPDGGLGVTVSPSTIQVQKGTTYTFSAIVQGENNPSQEVIWTVEGGRAGTSISAGGLLTVAAGETAATLTVKATSTVEGYTNIFGTAIVTVTSQAVVVTITGVTVNPPTADVTKGGNLQFNATVLGPNIPPQTVTWTVEGGSAGTSITAGGLLIVAAGETAATLMVKAASTVAGYTNIVGAATVTVTSQEQEIEVIITDVMVNPPTVTLAKGGNQQFNAVVSGTNAPQTVTWTVEGSNSVGTNINTEGLLTVAAGETAAMLMVKATSTVAGYTHIFGTAIVSVSSPPAQGEVAVVPSSVTMYRGGTQQFSATIAGIPSNDVTWSMDSSWSPWTNINASGLLTVWDGDGTTGTITVTATSKADPAMFGTATVSFHY